MKIALFHALQEFRGRPCPVALVTELISGRQSLVTADEWLGDLVLPEEMLAGVRRMLAGDESGSLDGLFVRVYGLPWVMVAIGAVHITQALAPMAALAGFRVTVIEPRRAFARPERFTGVTLVNDWPDEALQRIPLTARTAVVSLTHDPKIDDVGLIAALRSPAFFIGALGSTRTHAKRKARLREAGFGDNELARIAAPVGLDLGGRLPGEIAAAISAELVGARHGRRRERP
jgi:xanthine dehydrogenase accessory factor